MAQVPYLVKDINTRRSPSYPWELTASGGLLFFTADDGEHGTELWVSDGTPNGTVLVKDIFPGSAGPPPHSLTAFAGRLFFAASEDVGGVGLWSSDGTPDGTVLVKDDIYPAHLTEFGGRLYFFAIDAEHGRELWSSDGTPEGTALVKDINPGPDDALSNNLIEWTELIADVAGRLFFTADDGEHGTELWSSDGTPDGTALVKDWPNRYALRLRS